MSQDQKPVLSRPPARWVTLGKKHYLSEDLRRPHPCKNVINYSSNEHDYSLRPHGLQPARLLCPWDSPGKDTGVGCHALLQGIFPTQGSHRRLSGLLHGRRALHHQLPRETKTAAPSRDADRSRLHRFSSPRTDGEEVPDKGLSSAKDWGRQSG